MNSRWMRMWVAFGALGGWTVTATAEPSPEAPSATAKLDAALQKAWREKGIRPADRCDDSTFLRRATLDLTGRLPSPERIKVFLEDKDPAKRAKAIDRLLADDGYAAHWANVWDGLLMGQRIPVAFLDRAGFKVWLRERFAENAPWDRMVRDLVAAEGYNTNKKPRNGAADPPDMAQRYNPAVNYFLRYWQALPELTSTTSKTFLGVQIQCAQCHDHKTESWTQDDFRHLTAYFAKTWPRYIDNGLKGVGVLRVEVRDRLTTPPVEGYYAQYFQTYKDYVNDVPKPLSGETTVPAFGSRRKALAEWMTAKSNPWFARATVNRMWAKLLGRGFVDPVDDFRDGNPPLLPELLQTLADDFTASGYDLKHLIRAIANSEAYQAACRGPGGDLWSSYPKKPLDLTVTIDSLLQATAADSIIDKLTKGNLELVRQSFIRQFVTQMGTDEQTEKADADETISRSLFLLNSTTLNGTVRKTPGLALAQVLNATSDDRERIEQLYLRTVSRKPTAEETTAWLAFLSEPRTVARTAGPPAQTVGGAAAQKVSPEIADAPADADFNELIRHARTAPDFREMAARMKNNADAGMYVKAFEAWVAAAPFQYLATAGGASTARDQAYEDLFWALLNGSEFLSNH